MNTTQMIVSAAFAGLAVLTPFAAQAQPATPAVAAARAFPNIMPDTATNTYRASVAKLSYGEIMEIVNCTTGTVSQFSTHKNYPGGGMKTVTEYPAKVQDMMRNNCNSNGLRAGF